MCWRWRASLVLFIYEGKLNSQSLLVFEGFSAYLACVRNELLHEILTAAWISESIQFSSQVVLKRQSGRWL